jgi:hypothetical protein
MYNNETRVWLIDTPGFNDTNFTDYEILTEIAFWLSESYAESIVLTGIVYVHDVGNTRISHEGKNNLELFKKLCGDDALQCVVLATTRWDEVPKADAERREAELRNKEEFWGGMISLGSTMIRQTGSPGTREARESARKIVEFLLSKRGMVLNIQKELVDQGRELGDTQAGQELVRERKEIEEEWKKKVEETEKRMQRAIRANQAEAARMMEDQKKRQELKLVQMAAERTKAEEAMRQNYERMHKDQMERLKIEQEHETELKMVTLKNELEKPTLMSIIYQRQQIKKQNHEMKMEQKTKANIQKLDIETLKLNHELEMKRIEEAQKTARHAQEVQARANQGQCVLM